MTKYTSQQSDFADASTLLQGSLSSAGRGFGRIVRAFEQAAGSQLSRVATATALKGGVLRVRCTSASWAQTLQLMHDDLLARLNESLDSRPHIHRIEARAGRAAAPSHAPAPPPAAQPLTPAQLGAIDARVAQLPPGELRDKVRAAWIAAASYPMDPEH